MPESFSPSSLPSHRVALTMPAVPVFCSENRLPKATMNSPAHRSDDFPSSNTGSSVCTWVRRDQMDKLKLESISICIQSIYDMVSTISAFIMQESPTHLVSTTA